MNRRKERIVAGYEFRNTVRRKAFILTTILMPLFVIVPVYLSATTSSEKYAEPADRRIGFVDGSGFLTEKDGYKEYADIEEAKAALIKGEINSFFVLGSDYLTAGNVSVYSTRLSPLSEESGKIIRFLTENLLSLARVDENISQRILQPAVINTISLDADGKESAGGGLMRFLQPYILSFMLFLSITVSSGYLMQGIGEEKESRTGELLLSSISADQLLKGKILGYGAVGLLQIAVWAALGCLFLLNSQFAPLLSGIQIDWVIGLAVIYYLLGYFLFSVSIACAAAISPTVKEAQQTASLFTFMAAIPMIFSSMIIVAPNGLPAKILTISPILRQ